VVTTSEGLEETVNSDVKQELLVLAHMERDVDPDSPNRKIMSIAVRESLLDLRIVDRQIMPGKGIGLVEVPDLIVDSQSPPNGIITRAALQENSFH
jgi:hypothetical protein